MMSSGSMAAYRAAGAFCEDPDWYEPNERRTRCTCGAFLPGKPTHPEEQFVRHLPIVEWKHVSGTGDNPEDWDEVIVGYEACKPEWSGPFTTCGRCNKSWEEGELWGFS